MAELLGVVGIVMLSIGGISKLICKFLEAGAFHKSRNGMTREEITNALVREDLHVPMLQWLNNPENFHEIEEHVSSVLSKVWGRDIHYIPKYHASGDIRKVIYFVENGFLPGPLDSDIFKVLWTDADNQPFGLSSMSKEEKDKLYIWVLETMEKNGYKITTMLPSSGMWTFAE